MADGLTLVVCGAPLAVRAPDIATALVEAGWNVSVVGTPASRSWLDLDAIESVTGRPAQFDQRAPTDSKRGPRPSCVVACPLTLNTGSKLATGIMDTYAAGTLCEALATRTPLILVPMVSARLWGHPAWATHLKALADAGVRFLDAQSGAVGTPQPVESGTGDDVARRFDASAIVRAVGEPA